MEIHGKIRFEMRKFA